MRAIKVGVAGAGCTPFPLRSAFFLLSGAAALAGLDVNATEKPFLLHYLYVKTSSSFLLVTQPQKRRSGKRETFYRIIGGIILLPFFAAGRAQAERQISKITSCKKEGAI